MTASSFSSEQIFQHAREMLVVRASEALKPLVEFMESHECDDEEILSAIFEAIAYEKDAEAELGVYAYDQRKDMNLLTENFLSDRFAEMIYKFGRDLFKELQFHRLYCNGFLPYQYLKHHGDDLVVARLDVPSILHRESVVEADRAVPHAFNGDSPVRIVNLPPGCFYDGKWYPAKGAPVPTESSEEGRRVDELFRKLSVPRTGTAEQVLGPMAEAFRDFYAAAKHTPTPPETDTERLQREVDKLKLSQEIAERARAVERDAAAEFEQEMRQIFSGLGKGPAVPPPVQGEDWTPEERADFDSIRDYYAKRVPTQPDERSTMTQDELNESFAKLLWAKQMELKNHRVIYLDPTKRKVADLVYRAKVEGDPEAAAELEAHVAKTIRIVDDEPMYGAIPTRDEDKSE